MKSFKEFISSKINLVNEENTKEGSKDWKKEFIKLEKGFIPPSNLKSIIQAFADSNSIKIMSDTSKELTMPKKTLYLTGGSVRDFLKNKTPKNYNLATNATPQQTALILKNAGFSEDKENKHFVKSKYAVTAYINGDEFEIETFGKMGEKERENTDNIEDDAGRRDLTINSMYIELSKSDGENNKLYDPTKKGWYDISHGNIKSVDDPDDSFKKDKLRMMRTIRFYSQYGKGPIDKDIEKAIKDRKSEISDLPFEQVKEEFLKGLVNPDIDPRRYLMAYNRLGLLGKVFPDVQLNLNVPPDFSNKGDKILAIAWILQNNPIEMVKQVLSKWNMQEKSAVIYLLKLKDFDIEKVDEFLDHKRITALSEEQIRNWVDLFNVDGRSPRPKWSKMVKTLAKFNPDTRQLVGWDSSEVANLHPVDRHEQMKKINNSKIKDMFSKELG
jgi:tRNA nucleotidyltransferase/poly(A) polymerase